MAKQKTRMQMALTTAAVLGKPTKMTVILVRTALQQNQQSQKQNITR